MNKLKCCIKLTQKVKFSVYLYIALYINNEIENSNIVIYAIVANLDSYY